MIRIETESIAKANASQLVPAGEMTIALAAEMIVRTGIDAGTSQVTNPDKTMTEMIETDQEAVGVSVIATEIESGPGGTATTMTTETGTRGGTGIATIVMVVGRIDLRHFKIGDATQWLSYNCLACSPTPLPPVTEWR